MVAEFQRAYDNLTNVSLLNGVCTSMSVNGQEQCSFIKVVGERLARSLRARGDDDDIDDPDDSGEAPTTEEPKTSTAEVFADLDLPMETEEPEDLEDTDSEMPAAPVLEDPEAPPVVPGTAPVNHVPEDKAPDAMVPETAPVNQVLQDKAPDAVVPDSLRVNQVSQDKAPEDAVATNAEHPGVKDSTPLLPRQPSEKELEQQLLVAELKLEAKRLKLGCTCSCMFRLHSLKAKSVLMVEDGHRAQASREAVCQHSSQRIRIWVSCVINYVRVCMFSDMCT